MEVAALVLMAAGVGINYGWQPMPDGSSRYEYVVQIEPEMLATLGEDGSIPIVSEVPEHVRPIGRIRVVVGRGDLPRERLVKRMKPPGEAAAASGSNPIELAQYNQFDAAGGRYGQSQPAAAAPSDASSWNGGDAQPATPTTGAGGAWNQDPISVAQRPGDQGPMARVGDSIDNATAPLRQGLERVDNGVRTAVGNLGDRTRNLVDELGRPFQPRTNPADNRAAVGAAPTTPAPMWNGSPTGGTAAAPAQQYTEQSNAWNGSDAPTLPEAPAFAGSPRGAAGTAGTGAANPGGVDWNSPQGSTSPQRLDQPIDPRDVGRWDNTAAATAVANGAAGAAAAQPGSGAPSAGNTGFPDLLPGRYGRPDNDAAQAGPVGAGNPAGFPAGPTTGGPRIPPFDNAATTDGRGSAGDAASRSGDAGRSPKIELGMLQQPASRPLDGTESSQAAASNMAGPAFPTPQTQPAAGAAQPQNAPATGARAQGWDWATRGAASQQPGAQNAVNGSGTGRQAAAALFAWVLLTSSAAGNLYLFWSYQDVRHKYRALVRKTARAVGSRLSAA